jgi:hypothetical protein
MESVVSLRDSVGDAFITLPLLLLGFVFLFGTLTSNTGLLLLFIGQVILVPILGFLGSVKLGFNDTLVGVKTFAACLVFYAIHSGVLASSVNYGWAFMSTPAIIIFFQWLVLKYTKGAMSHFDIINPARWFGVQSINPSASQACSITPKEATDFNHSPTDWANHVVFFFGFLISNAVAVYSEPTPKVTDAGTEQEQKERQARVDARVANRKFLTACIMAVCIVVLALLLAFRYNKSGCEETIALAFVPLLIAGLTGSAWFTIIYKSCGVRPTDILGIVQGMVPTELVDNPIVCVGS